MAVPPPPGVRLGAPPKLPARLLADRLRAISIPAGMEFPDDESEKAYRKHLPTFTGSRDALAAAPEPAIDIYLAVAARLVTKAGRDWHYDRMQRYHCHDLVIGNMSPAEMQIRQELLADEDRIAWKFANFARSIPAVQELPQAPGAAELHVRFLEYLEAAPGEHCPDDLARVTDDAFRFWRFNVAQPSQVTRAFATAAAILVSMP
jgi:hypothetical protein